MNWLDICALDEINTLDSRIINGPKGDVAIFRTSDGEVLPSTTAARKGGPLIPRPDLRQTRGLPAAQLAN